MIKIGFSSLACPGWDLDTIIENASTMGFDGVELRGLRGELQLPLVPELARRPETVRQKLAEKSVELVCLGTSATLDSRKPREVARQQASVAEYIELAEKLGCPSVRLFIGEVQKHDHRRLTLSRIAQAAAKLAPVAARHNVTLLIENGGDFVGSDDLWFVIDAVNHPNVRCCWNQCHAKTVRERPTNSIPRLGKKIGLVHMCDATFTDEGLLTEYVPLGEGDVEVAREIELLKGLVYDRYLVFEWPKLWTDTLPEPDTALPEAAAFLRKCLDDKQKVLSAYKGDKNPAKLAKPKSLQAAP